MTSPSGRARRQRHTVGSLAREFQESSFGSDALADGWLSRRLTGFLVAHHLERIAADRDAFDVLLNRVMELRETSCVPRSSR